MTSLWLPQPRNLSAWPIFAAGRLDPSTSGRPHFTSLGENRLFARIVAENAAGKVVWSATFKCRSDAWKYWRALTSGEKYLPDDLPIWAPGPVPDRWNEPILWAYVNHAGYTSSTTFTCPVYWFNLNNMQECVGAGGSAGAVFIAGFAGCCTPVFQAPSGGAGAAYASNVNETLVVGTGYAIIIPGGPAGSAGTAGSAGGSCGMAWFAAVGGPGGVATGSVAGGNAASCVGNSTKTSGGGAVAIVDNVGQGGGGAGGPHGAGTAGSSSAGGYGDAGNGGAPNGGTGTEWQGGGTGFGSGAGGFQGGNGGQFGGGGGSGNFSGSGGAGNQGGLLISWTQFTFTSGSMG